MIAMAGGAGSARTFQADPTTGKIKINQFHQQQKKKRKKKKQEKINNLTNRN